MMLVDDVAQTRDYYVEHLGFALAASGPRRGRLEWALLQRDGMEVLLHTRARLARALPTRAARPPRPPQLRLGVADVGALYDQVRSRVAVVQELHAPYSGGREFSICDLNGYILTFTEP